MRDITSLCHVGEVDDGELAHLFSNAIHRAQFTSPTRVDMPDGDDPQLSLHYTRTGKLSKVETELGPSEVASILQSISDNLLVPPVRRVGRRILFADVPVTGTWACSFFTITTAPPEAPRPPSLLGDYPFILEIPFDATPDQTINSLRVDGLRRHYELLLSIFLPLLNTSRHYGNQHWGLILPRPQPDADHTPRWVQEVYGIDGFEGIVDATTSPADPLIAEIPDTQFYGRQFRSAHAVFEVPASLGA